MILRPTYCWIVLRLELAFCCSCDLGECFILCQSVSVDKVDIVKSLQSLFTIWLLNKQLIL